ncbi:MAG TPA: hypothetical protein VHW23_26960 [Kofleriaceae bacterium]|nr:hypothetical protein [Kofleriaceae bacterium]
MGLIGVGLIGVGCKSKPENAPELRSEITKEAVIGAPAAEPRLKVVRRPNGDLGVISPDGKQVIVVQPDGYQVCEPSGDSLLCGPLTQMSVACPECRIEPCPCTSPLCKNGCLHMDLKSTGSGSAIPGTP